MSNKVYDVLKKLQRFLPSVSVFLATILALYSVKAQTVAIVVGTVDAIAVLLGAALEISTANYNMIINTYPSYEVDGDPERGDLHE